MLTRGPGTKAWTCSEDSDRKSRHHVRMLQEARNPYQHKSCATLDAQIASSCMDCRLRPDEFVLHDTLVSDGREIQGTVEEVLDRP